MKNSRTSLGIASIILSLTLLVSGCDMDYEPQTYGSTDESSSYTTASQSEVQESTEEIAETVEYDGEYAVTKMSEIMYAKTTVNIRSGPSKSNTRLGSLSTNEEINVTGLLDNGWYRVDYKGEVGYIRSDLLMSEVQVAKEKTTEKETQKNNNEKTNEETNNNVVKNNESSVREKSSSGSNGNAVTVPDTPDTEGNLVWIPTNGGTKYHTRSTCSGMKDPIQVTLEHAEANGFTPCKRCH